ncbi:PP2C family protein-serine/threonine phosphatase [Spiroplasma endosymbiont of Crioceris asparagi]|uniref:PP2C family protein-serine/threonine phosphatase n=1 Tax=Spiroplasma endosymbiont of Crioceris asparagi TaxID=3066286 RepID=UPI0030D5DF92
MKYNFTKLTDVGNYRKNNQDYLDFVTNSKGEALAIVCDGMGGHAFGEVASKIAVEEFVKYFNKTEFSKVENPEEWLKSSVERILEVMINHANKKPETLDMGTTLTAVLFVKNRAFNINIGDSRTYKIEDEELVQISVDQNLWNQTNDQEKEAARKTNLYAKMNEATFWKVLTSALGPNKSLKIDIKEIEDPKGIYMLTTDGVHDYIDEEVTASTLLNTSLKLKKKAYFIVEDAKDNISTDNLSILIVEAK